MKNKFLNKKILIIILCFIFLSAIITGTVFAYYEITNKGWKQNISSTNVVFKVNGHDYSTIDNNSLKLTKGEKKEVDLCVSVKSNNSNLNAVMKYAINFIISDESELARAIEVYSLKNGEYVFNGMLNNLNNIYSYLPINCSYIYKLFFVLSESAGEYYNDKNFSLSLEVSNELETVENIQDSLILGDDSRIFVKNESSFVEEFNRSSNEGKIITLLDNITLNEDINSDKKIGIDLNGYNLTLNNNININYNYEKNSQELGIINNSLNNSIISGTGTINVNGNDCYIVSDNLTDYFNKINITIGSETGNRIVSLIDERKTLIKDDMYLPNDNYTILSSLSYYIYRGFSIVYTGNIFSLENNKFLVIIKPDNTTNYDYSFTLVNSELSFTSVVSGTINVRGNSVESVATSLINDIPEIIDSSLFLKSYDSLTNCNITWITDEKYDDIFNSDGTYLSNGYLTLLSWQSKKIEITIKVSKDNLIYTESFDRIVEIVSAKQRTDIIYNNNQCIFEEIDDYLDISSELINTYLDKVELKKIKITIDGDQNTSTDGYHYLEIYNENDNFDCLKVVLTPQNSVSIDISVTFYYNDINNEELSYTLQKQVVVLGNTSSFEVSNSQNLLQAPFDNNLYTNGGENFSYKFEVLSKVKDGVFVEYKVLTDYSKYILSKDIYVKDINGDFYFIDNNYTYINKKYSLENDGYVEDEEGEYILINDNYFIPIADNLYTFKSVEISILPGYVPTTDVKAEIKAFLYEYDNSLNKTYVKDNDNNDIVYILNLNIKGVYHNIDTEISDYSIYNKLLEYFDFNNDGYIGKAEAETAWFSSDTRNSDTLNLLKMPEIKTYQGKNYYYINIDSLSISNLKGLEYFKEALGYNLSSNYIINIDYFKDIYNIEYLDLSNNSITNIESLSYLDNIGYLDLKENYITNIEPIKYLENIEYLDFLNNIISDFSPLIEYKSIKYLRVYATGSDYCYSDETLYYMTLILVNNSNVSIYCNDKTTLYTADDSNKVMAKILYNIQNMNTIYQTLYLPSTYLYKGTTYNISYQIPINNYLTLIYDKENNFYGYNIITPVTSFNIKLTIKVSYNGTTSTCARIMNLTLLQNQSDASIIPLIEISDGVVEIAKNVVPDDVLRSILFETFNHNETGTVNIGGNEYNEKYIITQEEIAKEITTREWNNQGIKDLTGLRYFRNGLIGAKLYLNDNKLNEVNGYGDISELAYLGELDSLVLGGQLYDFSMLINESVENNLTSLTSLYVSKCYNLNDENILNSLYKVYIENKKVVIYKDSDTSAWDPYEDTMDIYSKNLPSLFTFKNIDEENSFFENNSESLDILFYNYKTISFKIDSVNFYEDFNNTSSSNYFTTVKSGENIIGIKYKTLVGFDNVVYANAIISASDGRGYSYLGKQSENFSYNKYNVKLQADFNDNIKIIDVVSNKYVSINEIFVGKTLRNLVMGALYTYIKNENNSVDSLDKVSTSNGKFYKNGNIYYINKKTLSALNISSSIEVDSSYFSDYVYLENGTKEKGIAVSGLRYLSQVKVLTFLRDAYLGTGEDLVNLTTINYKYSYLDLGTLKIALPSITEINSLVSGNAYTVLYRGDDYYLRYFYNLTKLTLYDTAISDWNGLKGLLPEYWNNQVWDATNNEFISADTNQIKAAENNLKLSYLKIYSSNNTYKNKNTNLSPATDIMLKVYNIVVKNNISPTYYLGSSTDSRDTTTTYPWDGSSSESDIDITNEYNEFVGNIKELDVQIENNGVYQQVYKSDKQLINSSDTIILPYDTSYVLGSEFTNQEVFTRKFAINWYIFGIDTHLDDNALNDIFNSSGSSSFIFSNESVNSNGMCYIPLSNYTKNNIMLNPNNLPTDYYFVIIGTIGNGYFNNQDQYVAMQDKTIYSFIYPFLITSSKLKTNSMSYFEDYMLRFMIFTRMTDNQGGYNTTKVEALTNFSMGNSNFDQFATGFSQNQAAVSTEFMTTLGNTVSSSKVVNIFANITTLNGISKFPSIKTLSITAKNVYDISDVANLSQLTNIKLTRNLISNVASLSVLKNIIDIDFSENSISDIKDFIDNSQSKNKIKTMNLSYNPLIEPEDFEKLTDFSSLSYININYTLCDNDFRTLKIIKNQIDNGVLNRVYFNNVLIKDISNNTTFTNALDNFILECDTSSTTTIGTYLNTKFVHSANTTQSSTIVSNGITYTITLSSMAIGTNRTKLGYNVKMPLTISSETEGIKANFIVNYVSSTTTNIAYIKVGNNKYTADINAKDDTSYNYIDFDSSLWSVIISKCNGDLINGYTLNQTSLTIDQNYNITSLKGINKLGLNKINISNNKIENLWNSLDSPYTDLTSLTISGGVFTANDLACLYGATNLNTLDLSLSYGINYNDTITLRDNQSIKLSDMLNNISTLKTLKINNEYTFLATNSSGNKIFGLNSAKANYFSYLSENNVIYTNTDTINISTNYYSKVAFDIRNVLSAYFYYLCLNNSAIYNKYNYNGNELSTIKISNSQYLKRLCNLSKENERYIVPDDISAIDIVGDGLTYNLPTSITYYGITYGISWKWKTNSMTSAEEIVDGVWNLKKELWNDSDTTITLTPTFTNGLSLGSKTINITNIEITTSKIKNYFVEVEDDVYLPANSVFGSMRFADFIFLNYVVSDDSNYSAEKKGYILTQDTIKSITSLDIKNSTNSIGMGTLDGIEIFTNLKKLYIMKGCVLDLSAIKTLQLTDFAYIVSDTTSYYYINDFSPLIEGSKDTLVKFEYAGFGNVNINDLSFLSAFSSLNTVILNSSYNNKTTLFYQYIASSSFKYLVSSLDKKNVNIYVPNNLKNYINLSSTKTNITTSQGKLVLYKIMSTTLENQAEQILSLYNGDTLATIEDGYKLLLQNGNVSSEKITALLPTFIDNGGVKYIINYVNGNFGAVINGYKLILKESIKINDRTYNNDEILNYEEAKELISTNDFSQYYNSGIIDIKAEIVIEINSIKDTMLLLAKINVNNINYERMFTLDYSLIG